MRILHTSDWHLGKRLGDASRLEEQENIIDEICGIAESQAADAIVIAGDLFDTFNPATEAVELFYKSLKRLANDSRRPVIAIAGNHDSPDRIESPDPLARECGIILAGYPNTTLPEFALASGLKLIRSDEGFIELQLPTCSAPLRILHTSYANEFRMQAYLGSDNEEEQLRDLLQEHWSNLSNKYCDQSGVNIMVSHLFFTNEGSPSVEEPDDEKPILHVGGAQAIYTTNVPANLQYVALGHLHRKQMVGTAPCPIVYSGSPLSYSFAETNQDKYVLIVDAEPGLPASIKEVKLEQGRRLLRYKAQDIEDAVQWLTANTESWVELTLVADTYLLPQDLKLLKSIHQRIVAIIPEIRTKELLQTSEADLTKSTEELFADYFTKEKGQAPNEAVMALFKEILAEEDEQ